MISAAVLIRSRHLQYDGLRTCVGLQLGDIQVRMLVLHHEIENMDQAYDDNLIFFREAGGQCFSNNPVNVEEFGFQYAGFQEMAQILKKSDHVIPF